MNPEPQPRLLRLEQWVERIRNGHVAALWLARDCWPEGDIGWISTPIVVWREESKLSKFDGHLRPVPVYVNLQTGVYPAEFSATKICRTGHESWREQFTVDRPMNHRQMRAKLRQMVTDADQARFEVIEWSKPFRDKHTKRASAGISATKGVTEGFLFDLADIRAVSDQMIEVVLDQFDRYAGITRRDRHGKVLAGRPGMPIRTGNGKWTATAPIDLEHQVKEYLRSRPRRAFAKLLRCDEKELRTRTLDSSWIPVARSCEYLNDLDVDGIAALPAADTRQEAQASLVERAKRAVTALEENGGARAVALRALTDTGSEPRRLMKALRCPWQSLPDDEYRQVLWFLVGQSVEQATHDWCDALHWWVSEGTSAPPPKASAATATRLPAVASQAAELVDGAGGPRRLIAAVFSGGELSARHLAALTAPWGDVSDAHFIALAQHLSDMSDGDATDAWRQHLGWAVETEIRFEELPHWKRTVNCGDRFGALLPAGQMELIAA